LKGIEWGPSGLPEEVKGVSLLLFPLLVGGELLLWMTKGDALEKKYL